MTRDINSVVDSAERKRAELEREGLLHQLRTLNAELEQRVQARTAELVAMVQEREVLLQEVHHRVKNNLQVISSLINMQAARSHAMPAGSSTSARHVAGDRPDPREAVPIQDYARVPFAEYARGLASSVFDATACPPRGPLELAIEESPGRRQGDPLRAHPERALCNALKHAFPDGRAGSVRVELVQTPGEGHLLAVADDGVGLPPGIDIRDSSRSGCSSYGCWRASWKRSSKPRRGGGTCFQVTIPEGR